MDASNFTATEDDVSENNMYNDDDDVKQNTLHLKSR
jgi:hypothetical protein